MSLFDILRGDVEASRGSRGRVGGGSAQHSKAGPGRRHVQGSWLTRLKQKHGLWRRRLQPSVGPGSLFEFDEAMRKWLQSPYDYRKPSRRTRKGDGSLRFAP